MAGYKDNGTFTTAASDGPYRISLPIPRDNTARIVEQDFIIAAANFAAATLDTAHATITAAKLVEETPPEDVGGGIVRWTRRYATKPANRDDFETFSYRFPGLYGSGNPPYNQYWTSGDDDGRDPFTKMVTSRLRYEYFLCASGETYTTPGAIPILPQLEFTLTTNAQARMDYLLPAGDYLADTVPTKEAWITLVGGGTGIGTGANAGEFIAEDSRIENYMGNIWARITRYIKAI